MSNYRVQQVLALGAMPERQLRFLIALATWMNDDTRTVRVGIETVMTTARQARNTARTARRELEAGGKLASESSPGRGRLTLWTVLCLPEKGGSEFDPHSADAKGVNETDPLIAQKGVNQPAEKGSTSPKKRGQPESADLRKRDHGLNRRSNPSVSARKHAADDGPDLTQTIAAEHGWTVDHARRVVDGILADSRDVRDPDRFVRWKITQDPSRYRPTPAPPPVAARLHAPRCEHGAEAGRCPLCRVSVSSPRAAS